VEVVNTEDAEKFAEPTRKSVVPGSIGIPASA
jgi:hypothetical protein